MVQTTYFYFIYNLRVERVSLRNNVHYCEEVLGRALCFSVVQEMDVSLVAGFLIYPGEFQS